MANKEGDSEKLKAPVESVKDKLDRVRNITGWYTLIASGTGAIPIPASSAAIIANNAFMIAHINSIFDTEITWKKIISSFGVAGTLNIAGRTVFIEAAKVLSWGTGSLWALAALSVVGATTAGLQTYIIGLISIEIIKNGGKAISAKEAGKVIDMAKETYKTFKGEMKKKDLSDPGKPKKIPEE